MTERFFPRTYLTAGCVAAIVALGLWAHKGWPQALALLAGAVAGTAFLASIVVVVHGTVRTPAEGYAPRWPYVLLAVGKYVVVAGFLWLLLRWSPDELLYGAAGVGIPLAVLVLRVAGRELNRRAGVEGPGEDD